DAAGLDDRDEHDERAVDQEIPGSSGAAEGDARPLAQWNQDGRPDERAPEGAHAAEYGDQADQDAQRGREDRLGVDEEDVLGIEAPAEAGQPRGERHRPLL